MTKKTSLSFDCERCGLYKQAHTPKMKPFGGGRLKIALVGESPGVNEDLKGRPFIGRSGDILQDVFNHYLVNMDNDCFITNSFQCIPPKLQKTKTRTDIWTKCCQSRLEKQLLEFQPRIIITFGMISARAVLEMYDSEISMASLRGTAFPSHKYGCWVGCAYHPAFLMRKRFGFEEEYEHPDLKQVFYDDIGTFLADYMEQSLPKMESRNNYKFLSNVRDVEKLFFDITNKDYPVAFDYETTCLFPKDKGAKILSVAFTYNKGTYFLPLSAWNWGQNYTNIKLMMKKFLSSNTPKIVQSFAFEDFWSKEFFGCQVSNLVNDTQITSHLLDERSKTTSLGYQVFRRYGDKYKDNIDRSNLESIDIDSLAQYNCLDSQYTYRIHNDQDSECLARPTIKEIRDLFMDASPVLSIAKQRGIKVDEKELELQKKKCKNIIDSCNEKLKKYEDVVDKYKKKKGIKTIGFKPTSHHDLRYLLYDILKAPASPHKTNGGSLSTDAKSIDWIIKNTNDKNVLDVCGILQSHNSQKTMMSTFLTGFQKAIQADGLMHPSFLLDGVETGRSSSEKPNFQNLPKRKETQADFRKVIVPKYDYLIEVDASGSEIATLAMIAQDEYLTDQLNNGKDLHRFWASVLYKVPEDKVTKEQRYKTKNQFVFPEFYGSFYTPIAESLKMAESHVKKVEEKFWKEYASVREWQNTLIKTYTKKRYVEFPLGFRRYAPLTRNQIINSPVQGSSFFMLLKSMVDAERDMRELGLKSEIIAEVHDSIIVDTVDSELEIVVEILDKRMSEKQWDWQGDVLRRCEISVGYNWKELQEIF